MAATDNATPLPRAILWTALAALLVVGLGYGCIQVQQRFWEQSLIGPFTGRPAIAPSNGTPMASRPLLDLGILAAFQTTNQPAPILVLRDPAGSIRWSRELLPVMKYGDGSSKENGLRDLRLYRIERRKAELVVHIVCYRDYGGHEGGLIHLNLDGDFSHFMLSW